MKKKRPFCDVQHARGEAAGKESDHGGSERLPCSLLARTFITGLPTGLLVFHGNSRVHYGLGYHVGCFFKGPLKVYTIPAVTHCTFQPINYKLRYISIISERTPNLLPSFAFSPRF